MDGEEQTEEDKAVAPEANEAGDKEADKSENTTIVQPIIVNSSEGSNLSENPFQSASNNDLPALNAETPAFNNDNK